MFAVSRCPVCCRLHGLIVPLSTTTCRRCGKRYDPTKGHIVKVFESDYDMRVYIQTAQSLKGGLGPPIVDKREDSRRTSRSDAKSGRTYLIKLIEKALKEKPASWQDLLILVDKGTSPEMVDECIKTLMEEGLVFQTSDGKYTLVPIVKPS